MGSIGFLEMVTRPGASSPGRILRQMARQEEDTMTTMTDSATETVLGSEAIQAEIEAQERQLANLAGRQDAARTELARLERSQVELAADIALSLDVPDGAAVEAEQAVDRQRVAVAGFDTARQRVEQVLAELRIRHRATQDRELAADQEALARRWTELQGELVELAEVLQAGGLECIELGSRDAAIAGQRAVLGVAETDQPNLYIRRRSLRRLVTAMDRVFLETELETAVKVARMMALAVPPAGG